MRNAAAFPEDAPVFVISVAAQLAGMHPQTLRQYDRLGLVNPGRTPGGRVLRVKGRGVHTSKGTGDLLAIVQVAVPSRLSKSAEEKLAEFVAELPDENPRDDLIAKARG